MVVEQTSSALVPARQIYGDAVPGTWWVVHTRARHEKALAAALRRQRVAHYLPLVRRVRMHGTRRAVVEFPLFPGYLFLWGRARECEAAWKTRRVAGILPVVDQARFCEELEPIRRIVDHDEVSGVDGCVREGTRCRVVGGALCGIEGVVLRRQRDCRLYVAVTMLGRSVVVEIDGRLLEPVD